MITIRDHLVYYIVNSYNLSNFYNNKCILQTLD
jgi:hypothetical protein